MERALFIGRFQPFHLGHEQVVRKIENNSKVDEILIGVGSSQYEGYFTNPFSFEERRDMIQRSLRGTLRKPFSILPIPDVHDDAYWVNHVQNLIPDFETLYTGSEWVKRLFVAKGVNVEFVRRNITIRATELREALMQDGDWQDKVPEGTRQVLEEVNGSKRLREMQFRHLNPKVTSDMIIPFQDMESVILIRRKNNPFRGLWALPGGYIRAGLETTLQTAIRETEEETGIVLTADTVKRLGVYDEPDRDPRWPTISHVFYSIVPYAGEMTAADDAADINIFKLSRLPGIMAFDHKQILADYQRKVSTPK